MLSLSNFEETIDPVILERGREYYYSDAVSELRESEDHSWSALVAGTRHYEVEITEIKNGELLCICDCPYDYGPVCKHITAVLFAIQDIKDKENQKIAGSKRKKRKSRYDRAREILEKMERDELIEALGDLSDNDPAVANLIIARYSTEENSKKSYVRLVKDALKLGMGRGGFIDYHGSSRAASGVQKILDRAEKETERGNLQDAVTIYQAVVETIVAVIMNADDSNGELGFCIDFALKRLGTSSQALPEKLQQHVFEYCLFEAQKEKYADWNWEWDLAAVAGNLVRTEEQRKQLFALLDQMAPEPEYGGPDRKYSAKHDRENADRIRLSVIERLDGEENVREFLGERISNDYFRERMIELCIDRGELAEARRLCEDRILQSKDRSWHLDETFYKLLLGIAQKEGNKQEIVSTAVTLLLRTGSSGYLDVLREVVPEERWLSFREDLVQKLEKSMFYPYVLAKLYVQEGLWEQLMELMEKEGWPVSEQYHEYLEPRFPDRVSAVYEGIVWKLLEEKVNRKGYRQACWFIRRMKKLGEVDQADLLVEALRKEYKNRPALLDELGKL